MGPKLIRNQNLKRMIFELEHEAPNLTCVNPMEKKPINLNILFSIVSISSRFYNICKLVGHTRKNIIHVTKAYLTAWKFILKHVGECSFVFFFIQAARLNARLEKNDIIFVRSWGLYGGKWFQGCFDRLSGEAFHPA